MSDYAAFSRIAQILRWAGSFAVMVGARGRQAARAVRELWGDFWYVGAYLDNPSPLDDGGSFCPYCGGELELMSLHHVECLDCPWTSNGPRRSLDSDLPTTPADPSPEGAPDGR